jgi:hypothetical protein
MDLILFIMDTGNWISIIDLLVTSALGLWIGYNLTVTFTTNRALKEHFISEIKETNKTYNSFINTFYQEKSNSKRIVEWFKIMSIQLASIESCVLRELNVTSDVLNAHNRLKQFLTSTKEFNENFNKEFLGLRADTQSRVLDIHKELKEAFVQLIIKVNNSRKKIFKMRIRTQVLLISFLLFCFIISTIIFVSERRNRLLREQHEDELILNAIVPDDINVSKQNMVLLEKAGFISKNNKILKKLLENDSLFNFRYWTKKTRNFAPLDSMPQP